MHTCVYLNMYIYAYVYMYIYSQFNFVVDVINKFQLVYKVIGFTLTF